MLDCIHITWDTGYIHLLPDFFPVEMPRTRKIFKMLLADYSWDEGAIRQLGDTFVELSERRKRQAAEAGEEAEKKETIAKSLKPHKRAEPDKLWWRYQHAKEDAQLLRSEERKLKRDAVNLLKTRDLLYEMAGVK